MSVLWAVNTPLRELCIPLDPQKRKTHILTFWERVESHFWAFIDQSVKLDQTREFTTWLPTNNHQHNNNNKNNNKQQQCPVKGWRRCSSLCFLRLVWWLVPMRQADLIWSFEVMLSRKFRWTFSYSSLLSLSLSHTHTTGFNQPYYCVKNWSVCCSYAWA